MKIIHYVHDLSVFPLAMSFRPASDKPDPTNTRLREPIVFVPGLGCHRNWFDTAFRHEALRSHTLLAIDLPGQGDSPDNYLSREPHYPGTMITLAGCVQGALELVAEVDDYDRIHVVAHSMGALPAYDAWYALPDHRRGRFISIEGNMTGEDCALASRAMAAGPQNVTALITEMATSPESATRRWAEDLASCDPVWLAHLAAETVAWCDRKNRPLSWTSAKNSVYLYGERTGFPEHHRQRFLDLGIIDQGIEGAGHFPMHDNPDDLWNIVASAVRSYHAQY